MVLPSFCPNGEYCKGHTVHRRDYQEEWQQSRGGDAPIEYDGPAITMGVSMPQRTLSIDGVSVPRFLYGTAWKEDRTRAMTELALRQGFRGIDTANQRHHYHEAAVGEAVAASVHNGLVAREDLFLQTKFTFRPGQDHRLPYDPKAPIPTQVEQSFTSSLEHLGTRVIDSY